LRLCESSFPAPDAPPEAATWPSIGYGTLPIRRILVVQTQRLGDVLCATPLFTALRRQFPRAHLAALVHRPQDQILLGNPDLNEVLTYDRQTSHRSLVDRIRFIGELRERRFDWVLSIHAASSAAFAIWQANAPWRTCVWRYGDYRKPHWARFFHQHVRQDRARGEKHEIEYNLDVLRELGMEPDHEGYRLCLLPEERSRARQWLLERGRDESRPLAVIHPGHGGGRQSWPAEQYSAVADGLVERGLQVAVTGSGAERELVERVASGMRGPALRLAGGMDIRQFAAALAEASLFVSVSTGPMHLASALRLPAVTLYGPTDLLIEKTRFCPYGSLQRAVVSGVRCVCPSSKDCTDAVCMTGLAPTMVLDAVDDLARSTQVRR
jgi:heptosyltransferase-3